MYFAHSNNPDGNPQCQKQHLSHVADMASEFAKPLGVEEEAKLAGLLHDLGKYGDRFQRRLEGLEQGLDHWSPGASAALFERRCAAAALAIQGHHIGLQVGEKESLRQISEPHPQGLTLSETDGHILKQRFLADGLDLPTVSAPLITKPPEHASSMLDVRMLYSALVDADFLDTEQHFKGDIRPKAPELEPEKAYLVLLDYMKKVRAKSEAAEDVNSIRDDLFHACITSAQKDAGVFTLTAPTGTGKTLAMLAFALQHAIINKLRRVVMVIPFLCILEQTARVYRDIFEPAFGENYILEHHSLAEVDGREDARLLAENWNAPIVITTSVQMLESLFSNRSSACRKLHRLAKSVILSDEVQTLPSSLAVPTLAALSHLSHRYRSSAVFSTATQPAFGHFDEMVHDINDSSTGWRPSEIASPCLDLFKRTRRTRVLWPESDQRLTWQDVANQLTKHKQALCIVNLKRHARELIGDLRDQGINGVYHLSTSMCPAHRHNTLEKVRKFLHNDQPCRLVATQCIEAGVDVDFPVVFRAFADLSSIAQAAGRCNRNGRRDICDVRVFVPEDDDLYPVIRTV